MMEMFLVGGAVRDKYLGVPVTEKDWVVVGAQAEQLLNLGYIPVGKDFPVFLHPITGEEYALARQERKVAPGYAGFEFDASAQVTLEQDLWRRDLTVNAMAETLDGRLVDPMGGLKDLDSKILRHVSPAFVEDPVRILRVARFLARYYRLGFRVAQATLDLMAQMVMDGEVDHLVPERIWKETSRALGEPNPECYFRLLRQVGALARIMPELDALFGVPQPPLHHPEIDTGEHSLSVLQQAALLSPKMSVRWAALIHDLGKAVTPPELWPHHYDHEMKGLAIIKQLCLRLKVPNDATDLALMVAQFHTHCHRAKELKASTLVKTLAALDAFRKPERFEAFLLCCEADARGRLGLEHRPYPQADYFREAFKQCQNINVQEIIQRGYKGEEIKNEIHRQRVHVLMQWQNRCSE
jgi:tRNA nucleotidyltransferase (CCA-adding enzyme)